MPDMSKIVDFIQLSSAVVKKAGEELAALRAPQQKRAAEAVEVAREAEKTADALIAAGEYPASSRPDVISALQDPRKVLRYTAKLAAKRAAGAPSPIGGPAASEKQASASGGGIIGLMTPGKKASDLAFEQKFTGR